MSVSHQRTLPGINPGSKGYLTFTDSTVSGTVDVTFGGALSTDPAITALQHGMLTSTPTADRTWTLPTAVVLLSNLTQYTNIDVGDGFEFIIRNLAAGGSGFDITLMVGVGITSDANSSLVIPPQGFSKYILRCDVPNPLAGQADFEIFQVDSGAINVGLAQVASLVATGTNATEGTTAFVAPPTFTLVGGGATGITLVSDSDEAGVTSGITITGPNALNSSTVTFAQTGIYKVTLTVSGNMIAYAAGTTTAGAAQFAIGLGANVPTIALLELGIPASTPAATANSPIGCASGSIILPIDNVTTDILNVYMAGVADVAAGDDFTPTLVRIVINKL